MAGHREFSVATDVEVYFCDPQSPWQRGTFRASSARLSSPSRRIAIVRLRSIQYRCERDHSTRLRLYIDLATVFAAKGRENQRKDDEPKQAQKSSPDRESDARRPTSTTRIQSRAIEGRGNSGSAASTSAMTASTMSSRHGFATIWTPMGSPSLDVPARTTPAGHPVTSKTSV